MSEKFKHALKAHKVKPSQKSEVFERQEQAEIETLCSLLRLPVYDVFSRLQDRTEKNGWK